MTVLRTSFVLALLVATVGDPSIRAFGQAAAAPPDMTEGAAREGMMIRLQFPNTDVKDVLAFYERLTGKRLIVENQVQGNVTIVATGDVSTAEAIQMIEINLLLNGYTLVPVRNSNIVKVVGTGKNLHSGAFPVISDEMLLPEGERIVTFLAKLRYADPTKLQQTLAGFIASAPGGYSNLTALPEAQTLLITESTATIRGLLQVIREIDVPPAEVVSEFIPLEQADAKDVLEKLESIFSKGPAEGGAGTSRPTVRPAATTPGGTALPADATVTATAPGALEIRGGGGLSEDSIIVGKIKLTADIRTNRIHVVTRPTNMVFVRKLIREFDSSAKFGEPVSRPLRWIPVGETLDVVVKSILEPGMKEDTSASASTVQSNPGNSAAGAFANNLNNNGSGGTSNGSAGGADFNVSEGLSTQPVDTTPQARVVGTTKIIADKNANAIIVIGSADVKSKVFRLLDKLDQRIPQVMLHTVIGELNLDQKEQFGVDYIIRNSGLGISPIVLGGGNGTANSSTGNDGTGTGASTAGSGNSGTSSGRDATSLVGFSGAKPGLNLANLLNQDTVKQVAVAGGSGLTGFVTAGNSMTAIVTALEGSNRFRVVSRPSIFTKNNKKAIIASGQEIAVPTSIQSALNSTNNSNGIVTNSSVQFKRIALQLEVVPLINSDREVSLDILQKVDEVSGSTRIDENDIPNIATRYVKTSVTVPNEGTLVLGGLIKQSQNRGKSGIPILGSIPVLGTLFSTTTKEKIRTELVILIRPVVSWSPPESDQIRQRANEFLNMEPDIESTLYPKSLSPNTAVVPLTHPRSMSLPAKASVPVKRK